MKTKLLILTSTSNNYIKCASNEICDYLNRYNYDNILHNKLSDLLYTLEKDKEKKDYSNIKDKIIVYETVPEIDLISLRNLITTSFCVNTVIIKAEPTKYLKHFDDCNYYQIIYPLYANNEIKQQNLKNICKIKNHILES